jgi:N-acetylglucosamine malate deacetylase 2
VDTHPTPVPAQPPGTLFDTVTSVLAVVAHPDDESFGLGALLATLTDRHVPAAMVCFTHGEASTLRDRPGDLAAIRADELRRAATVLGVDRIELHDHPDGALTDIGLDTLTDQVLASTTHHHPSHLLVFDHGGITGHPDHIRATEAALAAARIAHLPVLAWTLPDDVATLLNAEYGAAFVGRQPADLHEAVSVNRTRQWQAIACHRSQSTDNPVLLRRLHLLGDTEYLRVLHQPQPLTTRDNAPAVVREPGRESRAMA